MLYLVVPILCLILFFVDCIKPTNAPNEMLAIASFAWVIGIFAYKRFDRSLIVRPKKRAWFTYGVCLVLIVVFNGMAVLPSFQSILHEGAINVDQVLTGEYYRLFTAAFIHYNFFHMFTNVFAFFTLGVLCQLDDRLGFKRMFLVYFGSVLFSALGSMLFLTLTDFEISLGASGAVLGLLGAIWQQQQRRLELLVIFIVFNLFLQMAVPAVDLGSHLAGFLGGGLIMHWLVGGDIIYFQKERKK